MSEFAPNMDYEQFEGLKTAEHLALPTAEQAEPLRPGEADPRQRLETARDTIEKAAISQANPLEQLKADEKNQEPSDRFVNSELRATTKQRELQQLRRHLSSPDRALSRIIHQPVVRIASEAASATVSRPSGLLGGGLVAFLGTSGYLYLAKHLGFSYNYLIFLLLFLAGFMVGLVLELVVHLSLKNRHAD